MSAKWTRQTYRIVAEIIQDLRYVQAADDPSENAAHWLIERFTKEFMADNARFDKGRFVEACLK